MRKKVPILVFHNSLHQTRVLVVVDSYGSEENFYCSHFSAIPNLPFLRLALGDIHHSKFGDAFIYLRYTTQLVLVGVERHFLLNILSMDAAETRPKLHFIEPITLHPCPFNYLLTTNVVKNKHIEYN